MSDAPISKEDFIILTNTVSEIVTYNLKLTPELSSPLVDIVDGLLEKYKDVTEGFWTEFRADFEKLKGNTNNLIKIFEGMDFKDRQITLEDELAEKGITMEEFFQLENENA